MYEQDQIGIVPTICTPEQADRNAQATRELFTQLQPLLASLEELDNSIDLGDLINIFPALEELTESALFIRFTLTADMAGSSAAATVNGFYLGPTPGATVTVLDPQGIFPFSVTGSKGLAFYSGTAGQYVILACEQECLVAKAILGQDMCANGVITINTFTPISPTPFNKQVVAYTTAQNVYNHKGLTGDAVLLVNDYTLGGFVICDVAKHAQDVVFGLRISGTQLQVNKTNCALEYCAAPAWADAIELTECP